MTETSCIATRHPYPYHDTTGSVGWPIPNLDVKLVDDDGKDITGYDVRGELCVRGPTVIKGYFENPEANARDWDSDNYFHTGDIAYIDGKSKLYYIIDRKKVMSTRNSQGVAKTNMVSGTHQSSRLPGNAARARRHTAHAPRDH